MLFYTTRLTPRLQYISDFISNELIGRSFDLTTDQDKFRDFPGPKINYSGRRISTNEIWLMPHSLLFENTISKQKIICFTSNGNKAFFKTEGDLSFDIFAASFYLMSRYEEYLTHRYDMYGRYDHTNSLAYIENILDQPLINNWLEDLKRQLRQSFPTLSIHRSSFTFLPTYDIDMAWTYLHKGWLRNAGGLLRSLAKGKWKELKERIAVLGGKQKDPYDVFGWLNKLHEKNQLKPYYFFLLAAKPGRYDKNISPSVNEMKALIADHIIRYPVGIHPSWQSGDDANLLKKEISVLAAIIGNEVRSSRQHFIRIKMPETYRRLVDNGIRFDFSMGYGGINGFRASIATPFNWYDLEKNEQTNLVLFPFCYMEATSFYELGHTPQQALMEMRRYYETVRSVNGLFSMIWHNSFLGSDQLHEGWKDIYIEFIESLGVDQQEFAKTFP